MRGVGLQKITPFSTLLQRFAQKGGSVRFIFGFSTGHVGTTTMSNAKLYDTRLVLKNNIRFLFEEAAVPKKAYESSTWDFRREVEHVEYYYGPKLLERSDFSKHLIRVDLSHSNLYFYRGLLAVLNFNNANYSFVRIYRERVEASISMIMQSGKMVDFLTCDYFRFNPLVRSQEIVRKVPLEVWNNFSMIKKSFWAMDEVEARWEIIKLRHPSMTYYEINWSKAGGNIVDELKKLASILGTRLITNKPLEMKIHAGNESENADLRRQVSSEYQEYLILTNFSDYTQKH